MGITLIANITPQNNAFVGMVSSNQVIGSNLAGEVSVLPSSCISTNSISEQYLRVSNAPTDGYYLKYDATNDLTWDEVVAGPGGDAITFWSSQTNAYQDSIYYQGPVVIGESGSTYSTYKFQVFGDTFLSGQVTFIGQISGIALPEYPSSAVNKTYVDQQVGGIAYKGWAEVADGGTIAHGCGAKPSWVSVCPSGTNPFMFSITVDVTNITIYHTSPDLETFSWGVAL